MKDQEKETLIAKLNEAFLPKNIECDGTYCMGCWKDIVREAIKMIESSPARVVTDDEIEKHYNSMWEGKPVGTVTEMGFISGAKWMRSLLSQDNKEGGQNG